MHFVGYCIAGPTWHSNGAWKHPESDALDALNIERYEHIAQTLEKGLFDGLFFVDVQALFETFGGTWNANIKEPGQIFLLDPLPLLSAMARKTKHIGLSLTISTAFRHPFDIARTLATLDHVSGGRAAWNVVTSASGLEAQNYGMDQLMDRSLRYDHADEVLEACHALWDSWDEDAIIGDPITGAWGDPSKIKHVNYQGKWVKTRGPLTVPRSPQGRPVIMQAGSSERGRECAARWAEVVFTLQNDKASMQEFYRDLKGRVSNAGRNPDHLAILPATDIVIGETESIAREKQDYINSLASTELGLAEMSNHIGIDLSSYPLDKQLVDMEITQGSRGVMDSIMGGSKGMTLREAARNFAQTQLVPQLVGTPTQIADYMEDHFRSEACDGFIICPSVSPVAYEQFVKMVVPELQRRGVYRKEYAGKTFRENLRAGI
ncbi:LLM class flavin-dependent oxidoreductase [Falsirhodobacter sp. 1013]|uniref:LLM class flavin-dependent oxidoreductase n=1 Tax=Falsirhodobacter sp. 1013 TaxID=3417566 RepID=UPI003EB979C8